MAVYKIFPTKDATIYSGYPKMNTGIDEILEVSKLYTNLSPAEATVARILVQFPTEGIKSVINSYIGTGSYSASLKLYNADVQGVSTNYNLEIAAVYQSWSMGTGRFNNMPQTVDGVSWVSASVDTGWLTSGFPTGVTGSAVSGSLGGGNWYTASIVTQSFEPYTYKDLDVNITDIVNNWVTDLYNNNGVIIKQEDSTESDKVGESTLTYFSRDTHTIYPPSLDLKWDDSVFLPISQSFICSDANINVTLQNVQSSFNEDSVHKVRINVRDKFPVRTFSTGSLYTTQKYLPSSSYWSLLDYKTKDVIIDFDESATKVSADSSGNYFKLYMNGLEPSRYYSILVKSVINGEVVVFSNDYVFKAD